MTDKELDELEARLREAAVERKAMSRKMFKKELLLTEMDEWVAADAIAELREKNAGLVGVLGGIAGAIERGTNATGERPHYLKGKDGGKIEGEEIDTICEALLSIGRIARQALKENTQ